MNKKSHNVYFKKIDDARKLLKLDSEASLHDIKESYRKLSLRYHPDRCKDADKSNCKKIFQGISDAKDLLMDYCASYRYSFKERDVKKNSMDKDMYKHLKRFYDGWFGDLNL